jgi:thymidylate synthase (FAD)
MDLVKFGATPQEARSVLPNSLKTEVIMTANLREWRHFFRLRTSKAAHPQMREVTIPLLEELKTKIPVVFDNICVVD